MKNNNSNITKPQNNNANTNFNANKHRPDNKNTLDSREGEEQQFKGDDVTNNKKEKKTNK